MARYDMKANPTVIIAGHYRTFVDDATGKWRWRDFGVFVGLPAIAAGLSIWRGVELPKEAGVGLLTLSGLLGAFLFGALTLVSERAMNWADSEPARGKSTSEQALYLEQLAANAAYASLVCFTAAVSFLIVSVSDGVAREVSSAIGIALGLHMVLVLLMVMKRVFVFTQARLNEARVTGEKVHGRRRRGGQKAGSGSAVPHP